MHAETYELVKSDYGAGLAAVLGGDCLADGYEYGDGFRGWYGLRNGNGS